jgi:translation initiation factor IF-3
MTNYRRKKAKPKDTGKRYQINERINFPELTVITETGSFVGRMSSEEAINLANEQEKDLVVINPKANPPVAKIIEYSKFKYIQDKSEKNKTKVSNDIKTLRVSVRISVHDLSVQARKADSFLEKNQKVKLQVQMRGREKSHPELAKETMVQFLSLIESPFQTEEEPKIIADSCFVLLKPKS